jgi:hypothetical protein
MVVPDGVLTGLVPPPDPPPHPTVASSRGVDIAKPRPFNFMKSLMRITPRIVWNTSRHEAGRLGKLDHEKKHATLVSFAGIRTHENRTRWKLARFYGWFLD